MTRHPHTFANGSARAPRATTRAGRALVRMLDPARVRRTAPDDPPVDAVLPRPGELALLTGPSGGGKSTLLRAVADRAAAAGRRVVRLDALALDDRPCVDLLTRGLADADVLDALRELSAVGLGELWAALRKPGQLSDGQRWRLRLALALRAPRPALLVADEFAALLDRPCAAAVGRALSNAVRRSNGTLAALVATSHDDLAPALRPDVLARCDFGTTSICRGGFSRRPRTHRGSDGG